MTDFDAKNHWLIDRGDGVPSVNLVVLSFVDPLKLLNKTNDAQTINGAPIGMNQQVVSYFTSHNVRVMLSIGGITFVSNWDTALSTNPTQLGLNAAALAKSLGVGIEIDYEENITPNLTGLQSFITAYRSQLPYDATGANPAARLTLDVAAGDRFLIDLDRKATSDWLTSANPVIDYANAMVPNKQPNTAGAETNWQEHVDGKSNFAPPMVRWPRPNLPAVYISRAGTTLFPNAQPLVRHSRIQPEATCKRSRPMARHNRRHVGYMFWAAECPSTRNICTTPPNSCQGGVGAGVKTYNIPLPMPPLRQQ